MTKWLVLAVGVFLLFNGAMARTYGYENPARHCFNMDYIRVYGCFSNSVVPAMIVWGAILVGAGMILWSVLYGRRQKTS